VTYWRPHQEVVHGTGLAHDTVLTTAAALMGACISTVSTVRAFSALSPKVVALRDAPCRFPTYLVGRLSGSGDSVVVPPTRFQATGWSVVFPVQSTAALTGQLRG
jgi:hypothetical protein